MGKVFHTPKDVNERQPIPHHTHTNILLLEVIQKSKNVHIRDRQHIKRIILRSNVHEDYIFTKTRERQTNNTIL